MGFDTNPRWSRWGEYPFVRNMPIQILLYRVLSSARFSDKEAGHPLLLLAVGKKSRSEDLDREVTNSVGGLISVDESTEPTEDRSFAGLFSTGAWGRGDNAIGESGEGQRL